MGSFALSLQRREAEAIRVSVMGIKENETILR